ncbi:EAL domain-containing protein [Radiobacillus sp. PE A8.2]|uniref:EAL domain-containing protein n=1 Tax=Radiobacillus sp. PE A8.2 TaxID=3380349 RepID=UPI00388D853F
MHIFNNIRKIKDNLLPSSEAILDQITNGFFMISDQWEILYINTCIEKWFQQSKESLIGRNFFEAFPGVIGTRVAHYYEKTMNERIPHTFEDYYAPTGLWTEISVYPYEHGIIGYMTNITTKKQNEHNMKHMENHDYLTGLPNRRYFEVKLNTLIDEIKENGNAAFALLQIDIDRLRYINDTLGHYTGDELIKQLAIRLQDKIGDKAFIARLSGDEFSIIIDRGELDEREVESIARSIVKDTERTPFLIGDQTLYVTISLGMCLYPENANYVQSLIENSGLALYRAKRQGGNTYQTFNLIKDIDTFRQFSLEKDMRKAIQNNEFELHYQPRVIVDSGRIQSAEALIRWNHPYWGRLSPADFIPLAEETGFIHPLTKWVAQTVCQQLKEWENEGISLIPISINASAHCFLARDFVASIREILTDMQVDGKWIEIEVTETFMLDSQTQTEITIKQLRELGIKIALDDFGTGYSSLAYLTKFKPDVLKMDRSILQDVTNSPSKAAVVKSIIHLAHGLGIEVVAEGVETEGQLQFLHEYECDQIQGYIYSKPIPAYELLKLIAKRFLLPVDHENKLKPFVDKRQHARVPLFFPSSAQMMISSVQGKTIHTEGTEILIEDIGIGGLRFLAHLSLGISDDIIFKFQLRILGDNLTVYGKVVWQKEIELDLFQYGVSFVMDNVKGSQLDHTVDELMQHSKISPFIPNTPLVKMDKMQYLENVVAKK